ncbi:MAG: hypothetical protein LC126_16545 [Bryobacterales bacterium]|nr:hypothetical protein [Bryobacterales bacterium]
MRSRSFRSVLVEDRDDGFGGPENGSRTPWNKPATQVKAEWHLRGGH